MHSQLTHPPVYAPNPLPAEQMYEPVDDNVYLADFYLDQAKYR